MALPSQLIIIINHIIMLSSYRSLFRLHQFRNQSIDYYSVLGVPKTATAAQIKLKYYELAKIYHPDVNKEADAQNKFTHISKAYQVLSDMSQRTSYDAQNKFGGETEAKRQSYDGFQNRMKSKKQHWRHNQEFDPFTAYDEYFKKNRMFSKPRRGQDINMNLSISLEESVHGVQKQIKFSQQQTCQACQNQDMPLCMSCGGKKTIYNRIRRQKQSCDKCNGKGYRNQCTQCDGRMFVSREVAQKIHITKNTHHKSILRLQGLGNHGFKHKNGDLYVTIFVEESPIFKIDGNNVFSEHRVDYLTAVCGGVTKIRTLFGEEEVEIESGLQSGKQIRLFNKGLTSPYSKRRGDHVVKFLIKVPEKLSQKQRDLLNSLQSDI